MNPPPDFDALIRDHLERKAEAFDPRPRFERIKATLNPAIGPGSVASARPRRRWLWSSVAAAAVFLAFLVGLQFSPFSIAAEELVKAAQEAHHLPLDRCYIVDVHKESDLLDRTSPITSRVKQTRLWTRGQQFWIDSVDPDNRWAWGRGSDDRIWLAIGPNRGVRIDPEEIPWWLVLQFDLYSMQPETLLGDVLRHFDLTREPGNGSTHVVRAEPKRGRPHPNIRRAVIEFDPETKVVRRLEVARYHQNQVIATVTYTLVETRQQPDATYQLEGHLTAPYEIYTRDVEPERRRELAARLLGGAAEWLEPRPKPIGIGEPK